MTSCLKMATVQDKAMCLLWFFEIKPVIKMERSCRRDQPSDNDANRRWLKQFKETGSVAH
jgi:hypothetical protein